MLNAGIRLMNEQVFTFRDAERHNRQYLKYQDAECRFILCASAYMQRKITNLYSSQQDARLGNTYITASSFLQSRGIIFMFTINFQTQISDAANHIQDGQEEIRGPATFCRTVWQQREQVGRMYVH
jgi:hypothetical protein